MEYSHPHQDVIMILNELFREGVKFTFKCEQKLSVRYNSITFQVDILVTSPFDGVIEVLGVAVHDSSPRQRAKTKWKKTLILEAGLRYQEVWDSELYADNGREQVKQKLRTFLST